MRLIYIILPIIFWLSVSVNTAFASEKRIQVNLSNQHIYAYDGNTLIYDFLISSGKIYPTPTGTFKPWAKLTSTRMRGGSLALGTYYNLPNVPSVVYFYKGYAIHGAYWHNNFGHPMSHGCVNVAPENAKLLYDFIDLDTPITIYGTTPQY